MRYEVNDEVFYSIDEVLDYCIEEDYHRDDDYFEQWINERYDGCYINGVCYTAFDILSNADDDNYCDLKDEFCESENDQDRENARIELENSEDGDHIYLQNETIYVYDDEQQKEEEIDESVIEDCRKRLEEIKNKSQEEKDDEERFMNMFQNIGG